MAGSIFDGNYQTTTVGLNEAAKLLNDAIEKRAAALDPSKIITAFDAVGSNFRAMEKRSRKRNTANLTRWLKTLSPKEREQLLLQNIDPIGEVANSWSPIDVEDANLTGAWDTAISDATAFAKERNLRAQDTLTPEQIDEIYGSGRDVVSELGAGDQYLDLGDKELRENYKKRQDEAAKRLTGKQTALQRGKTYDELEQQFLGLAEDDAPNLMLYDDSTYQTLLQDQRKDLESVRSAEYAQLRSRMPNDEVIEGYDKNPYANAGVYVRPDNQAVSQQISNENTVVTQAELAETANMLRTTPPADIVDAIVNGEGGEKLTQLLEGLKHANPNDKEIQQKVDDVLNKAKLLAADKQAQELNELTDEEVLKRGVPDSFKGTSLERLDTANKTENARSGYVKRTAPQLTELVNPKGDRTRQDLYDEQLKTEKENTTSKVKEYIREQRRLGKTESKSNWQLANEYYERNNINRELRENEEHWSKETLDYTNAEATVIDKKESFRDQTPTQFVKDHGNMQVTNSAQYEKDKKDYIDVNKDKITEDYINEKDYNELRNNRSLGTQNITQITLKALDELDNDYREIGKLNSNEHLLMQEALLAGIASATKNNENAKQAAINAFNQRKQDAQAALRQTSYYYANHADEANPKVDEYKAAKPKVKTALKSIIQKRGLSRFINNDILNAMACQVIIDRFKDVEGLTIDDMKEKPDNYVDELKKMADSDLLDDLQNELALYQKIWSAAPDAVEEYKRLQTKNNN
jgi:hypothetical protein